MSEEKNTKKVVTKTIYLQYAGKEVGLDEVESSVKDNYNLTKKGKDKPKDIKIYLKPEDNKVYYVINNDYAGEVDLPLR